MYTALVEGPPSLNSPSTSRMALGSPKTVTFTRWDLQKVRLGIPGATRTTMDVKRTKHAQQPLHYDPLFFGPWRSEQYLVLMVKRCKEPSTHPRKSSQPPSMAHAHPRTPKHKHVGLQVIVFVMSYATTVSNAFCRGQFSR